MSHETDVTAFASDDSTTLDFATLVDRYKKPVYHLARDISRRGHGCAERAWPIEGVRRFREDESSFRAGRSQSAFPVTRERGTMGPLRATSDINGGGMRIRLLTGNGSIRIEKTK